MKVKVNCDYISQQSELIKTYVDDYYMTGVNKVSEIIESINSSWEGSAHDNFNIKMSELTKILDEFKLTLLNFRRYVKGYLECYELLSEDYSKKTIDFK